MGPKSADGGVKDKRRAEIESRGDEPVPKRYKHTKHVEVARDEAGKPIMPLSVSERLTVLSLVRGVRVWGSGFRALPTADRLLLHVSFQVSDWRTLGPYLIS